LKWVAGSVYSEYRTYADRYFADGEIFAVADGMGIGKGAVLAAEKAIELLQKFKPYDSEERIRENFLKINKELIKELGKLGDSALSGTTLSMLSFNGRSFYVGHVGDSRIYLFRGGELYKLTEDQVKVKGNKKVVKVLGLEWNPEVYTFSSEYEKGDIFLLASDGFVEAFTEEEVKEALSCCDVEKGAQRLKSIAQKKRGRKEMVFLIVKTD